MDDCATSLRQSSSPISNANDSKLPFTWRDGFRIVDLGELARQMQCKQCSSLLDLNMTQSETRHGLASVLLVSCECGTLNDVRTGKVQRMDGGREMFEVNIKASINMLLYGIGAEHVTNFLAVLDIPMPMRDDASLMAPPDSISVPSSSFSRDAVAPVLPSNSIPISQAAGESVNNCPATSSSPFSSEFLLIPSDDIKEERVEELSDRDSENISNGSITEKNETAKQRSSKEKEAGETSIRTGPSEQTISTSCAGAEVETKCAPDLSDGSDKAAEVLAEMQKTVERKYYRCPLCPRVLPSSRGFSVHVGRKHQVSNYQAEHYELGPNAGYKGDKAQDAVGEDAIPLQQPDSTPSSSQHTNSASAPKGMHQHAGSPSSLHQYHHDEEEMEASEEACNESTLSAVMESEPDQPEAGSVTRSGRRSSGRLKDNSSCSEAPASGNACRIRNCRKEFKTEASYKRHLQRVHKIDSALVCQQCGLQYDSKMNLKKHMTISHRSVEERKVVCKYCNETLPHPRALKRHIKAKHPRGSKKTYYCDECPLTFSRPFELKTHKLRHSGAKNYKCFYCDVWFAGSGNRLSHIRNIHHKERKFLCETCGASFNRAHLLREHERVHSGEKPFQCERCAERFTKKEYLTIHMRTHTGERPYKCELCGKAFTQRCSRSLHRRKIHGVPKQERDCNGKMKEVSTHSEVSTTVVGMS